MTHQLPDSPDGVRLKWYGTAAILLECGETKLFFDPFFFLRGQSYRPPDGDLSAAENILVTHGHLDHIADIPAVLKQGDGTAAVYCTARPREALVSKGVDERRIRQVKPGDRLGFGPFDVRVLKGRHIAFDKGLAIRKLLSPRLLIYRDNLRYMLNENRVCTEAGETVAYEIGAANKRILLLGSLNLDDGTEYPEGADLLILPFQGRSDIARYALRFIGRLRPKNVLLDHFDDSFPPISSNVKTGRFMSLMKRSHPGIAVICPQKGAGWINI